MALIAMMTAITGVMAQLSIPIGPVPITLSVVSVYLSAIILGSRLGTISMIIYVLIGATGIPVFANFRGGLQVLFGPTGGYLFGYILAAYLIGKLFEMTEDSKLNQYSRFILFSFIGLAVIYTLGVIQLKYVLDFTWSKAYLTGVAPFILFDLIKIFIAGIITIPVRNAVKKLNLINDLGVK